MHAIDVKAEISATNPFCSTQLHPSAKTRVLFPDPMPLWRGTSTSCAALFMRVGFKLIAWLFRLRRDGNKLFPDRLIIGVFATPTLLSQTLLLRSTPGRSKRVR